MNRSIAIICVLALAGSSPVYAWHHHHHRHHGRGTAAAIGFIGGLAIGSMASRPAPPRTVVRYVGPAYVASPMEQVFRTQSRFIRSQLQARLQEKGFYYSRIDASWGPGTRSAFEGYASSIGQTQLLTNYAGANELMRMLLSPDEVQQFTVTAAPVNNVGAVPNNMNAANNTNIQNSADSAPAEAADNAAVDPEEVQKRHKIADDQLALLNEVLKVETAQGGQGAFGQDKIAALKERISLIEEFRDQSDSDASAAAGGNTTLPVSNANARKVANIYPLIPYYTPGSGQAGELEVIPRATDNGLVYDLNFVSHTDGANDARNTITLPSSDKDNINHGIMKSHEWSSVAMKKGLRQLHQKVASCFPEDMCDDDDDDAPTKVLFMLYEDGSTAAKIQKKVGNTVFGYNLSIDSALLLASYLDYMKAKGEAEYGVGSMTDADLNSVFK